jgi:Zn finger protein HypA/HybF involved in hydrogenase expression
MFVYSRTEAGMSAGDVYCEYCQDTKAVELDDHRTVPCPHCSKQVVKEEKREKWLHESDYWD